MTHESFYYTDGIIDVGRELLKKYRDNFLNLNIDWNIQKESFIASLPKFLKGKETAIEKIDEEILAYTAIIIFLANRVYMTLKDGFEEKVYQDALEQELLRNHIPYIREKPLVIHYKYEDIKNGNTFNIDLQHSFRPDFYINLGTEKGIIVELKSAWVNSKAKKNTHIQTEEEKDDINHNNKFFRQTINYMSASDQDYGILLNFYGMIPKNDEKTDHIVYHTFFYKPKQ